MRAIVAIGLLGLAGCSSEAADLERQYEIVDRRGTSQERCDAAKKVQDAYLKAGDEGRYSEWKRRAGLACLTADLDAQNRTLY